MELQGEAAKMLLKTMASGMTVGPNTPRKTNLECPKCQAGLHYTENGVIHKDPDRRRVKCPECDFKGFHFLEHDDVH
jgi:transposase-like protein